MEAWPPFRLDERAGDSRGSQQADQRPLPAGVTVGVALGRLGGPAPCEQLHVGRGGIFTRRRDADVGEFRRAKLGKAGKGPTVQVTTNQLSTPGGRSAQRWSGDGPLTAPPSTGNWNQNQTLHDRCSNEVRGAIRPPASARCARPRVRPNSMTPGMIRPITYVVDHVLSRGRGRRRRRRPPRAHRTIG
jgi:hypothetical protein